MTKQYQGGNRKSQKIKKLGGGGGGVGGLQKKGSTNERSNKVVTNVGSNFGEGLKWKRLQTFGGHGAVNPPQGEGGEVSMGGMEVGFSPFGAWEGHRVWRP